MLKKHLKLGINRLAPHQSPASCRTLLSASTAVGWGATANNVAILIAPALAILALPGTLQTYYSAWRGSALRTCYRGLLTQVIMSVPERADFTALPDAQRAALAQILADWPRRDRVQGADPAGGRVLVQTQVLGRPAGLQALILRFELPWSIAAAWRERDARPLLADRPLLLAHLTETDGAARLPPRTPRGVWRRTAARSRPIGAAGVPGRSPPRKLTRPRCARRRRSARSNRRRVSIRSAFRAPQALAGSGLLSAWMPNSRIARATLALSIWRARARVCRAATAMCCGLISK